jgi:hypothetical protein
VGDLASAHRGNTDGPRKIGEKIAGLTRSAIRAALGISSCSRLNRLALSSTAMLLTPVTLPPGRRRLVTIPAFTGSVPAEKTMGIVAVALFVARAVTVPIGVTITAT